MAKKKRPVFLPLIGDSIEYGDGAPRMLWKLKEISEASLGLIRDANCLTNHLMKQELVSTKLLVYVQVGECSLKPVASAPLFEETPRSVKKIRVSGGWHPSSIELVHETDIKNFASEYEMLLFSQMIMKSTADTPTFCCRLCHGNEVFECCYDNSASDHVPGIDNHLTNSCSKSPSWLKHRISKIRGTKAKGGTSDNVGYSRLLRKRMIAHRAYKSKLNSPALQP